jgi:hypothetical protein
MLGGITNLSGFGFLTRGNMEGNVAAKKDIKMTVMIDEAMQADLGRLAFACDLTPSDLVRSCISLSLPVFMARPSLIAILPTLPTEPNREMAG